MVEIAAKVVLVEGLKTFLQEMTKEVFRRNANKTDKVALTDTILSIQEAISKTREFIGTNGYEPNTNLQEIWRGVLRKCVASNAGTHFPNWLFHKIDFWGNPQDWINNPDSLKLIPKLADLHEECLMLLRKLE